MRFIRLALIGGIAALGGCQSAQQQAQSEARADDAACRSYGLQLGTPAYADCRQRRDEASRRDAAAALGALSGLRQQQSVSTAYQMPVQRPVSTNCSTIGGITNCTTY